MRIKVNVFFLSVLVESGWLATHWQATSSCTFLESERWSSLMSNRS